MISGKYRRDILNEGKNRSIEAKRKLGSHWYMIIEDLNKAFRFLDLLNAFLQG